MPNIAEVAELAGVSTATVSKYLNGVKVKAKNAAAIDAAVKKLNFHPNDFARGLRTNKSMSVGVILPELDNLFFTSIISGVDEILDAQGYSTFVCICRSDPMREKKKLDFLKRKKIDGLIAVPCSDTSDFVKGLEGIPVVLIDRLSGAGNCSCVLSDNFSAAYNATEKLISCGHSKIGVLLGPDSNYTPIERRSGFTAAMSTHMLTPEPQYIKTGAYRIDCGYSMTKELMSLDTPPTAIFATNNELTIGAVTALSELGLIPGKDISFIGFDSDTLAKAMNPALTVMVQNVGEIGRAAANNLLDQIKSESTGRSQIIRVQTEMLEGNSVCSIEKK